MCNSLLVILKIQGWWISNKQRVLDRKIYLYPNNKKKILQNLDKYDS